MSSRKVFNFESKILIDETIKEYGYNPDIFGPSSAKFVIATCRFCGKHSKIRKGFFNKAGSACHKECKIEEQKLNSPFKDKSVREKAKKTIEKKYGPNRELIGKKISISKRTLESKEKSKQTNLEKYGVENVFQNNEIKKKIKKTLLEKYGVESPQQSKEVQEKTKQTNLKKYNVENVFQNKKIREQIKQTNLDKYGVFFPLQNDEVLTKTMTKFKETIKNNPDIYHLVHILRNDKEFWNKLKTTPLLQLCLEYNCDYKSLNSALNRDEFKYLYKDTYGFPTQQKQKEVYNIIKSFLNNEKILFNDNQTIHPYELDIYIPSKKFAIEFNGSYWHSEAVLDSKEARNKHLNKTKLCEQNGIRLFHIFENDWKNRKTQILNFIKTIIGQNKINVAARKCTLTISKPTKECVKFMDDNHIQGSTNSLVYFNLVYNNEIVASMTAARHHRQGIDASYVVLSRLCFKDGYNVQGGASKLFKAFKQWSIDNGYTKIISWSDNAFTQGNIYRVLGFELEDNLPPDYFYWSPIEDKYISKQSQRKKSTNCPDHLTEREWCLERGLYRIYDSGKKRWTYSLE